MRGTLHVIILQAEESRKPSLCDLDVLQIPALGLDNGTAHFQCEGKKVHFFIIIMYIQIVFQVHGYTGSFLVLGYTGSFPGTRLYTIQVVFQLNESQVVFLVHDYACSFPGTRLYMQFSGYTVIQVVFPGTRLYSQFLSVRQFSRYSVIVSFLWVKTFSRYTVIKSVSQGWIVLQVLRYTVSFLVVRQYCKSVSEGLNSSPSTRLQSQFLRVGLFFRYTVIQSVSQGQIILQVHGNKVRFSGFRQFSRYTVIKSVSQGLDSSPATR